MIPSSSVASPARQGNVRPGPVCDQKFAAAYHTHDCVLISEIPPMITDAFKERIVDPGSSSLSLHCVASGTPLPQVTWTLDGLAVQDNERVRAGDYVRRGGDVVSHVNISDVRVSDGGYYACIARSDVGEKVHEARINIRGPPTVRRMEDRYIKAGEPVRIQCPYSGYPITEIFWEKGEQASE